MEDTTADPYTHLFCTNDPPAQIEVASLRQGVETTVPRISQLRSELEFLEERLRLYRLALSPTRRLLVEIISEIFTFVDDKALPKMSMVCRASYSAYAALSYKRLTETRISFYSDIPCNIVGSWLAKPVKGVKTLKLEHETTNSPCGCYKSTVNCPWVAPEFVALLKGTSKLENMNPGLVFSSPRCLLSLVGSVGDTSSWHSLGTLDLTLAGNWPGRSTKYRTLLNNLPNGLKSLSLGLEDLDRGRSTPSIEIPITPFNTLTTLTLDCCWNSPFILSVIRASPNIEDLSLSLWNCRHTWTDTVEPVYLPKVHTLRLNYPDPDDVGETIKLLRLPALEHLTIDGPRGGCGRPQSLRMTLAALRLLPPTQPLRRIRSLNLKRVRENTQTLWSIFSMFPFLEHLVLEEVDFHSAELLKQHADGGAPGGQFQLLPALRKLEMRCLSNTFDLGAFLLFIKTRQTAMTHRIGTGDVGERPGEPSGLRQIALRYNSWLTGNRVAKLEAFWKESSAMLNTLKDDLGLTVVISRE